MSRYEITAGSVEAVVGWDAPLNTYFAQVWDRSKDEDDPAAELLWIGCTPGEIHDHRQVCNAVAAWMPVPPAIASQLYADAS